MWILESNNEYNKYCGTINVELIVYVNSNAKYINNAHYIIDNIEKYINKMKFNSSFNEASQHYKSKFITDFEKHRSEDEPTYLDVCMLSEPIDILDMEESPIDMNINTHKTLVERSSIFKSKIEQITEKEIMEKYNGHFARDNTNGKLIFIRKDIEKAQMQTLNKLFEQIGNNLLAGKINIMNISLPVSLFAK